MKRLYPVTTLVLFIFLCVPAAGQDALSSAAPAVDLDSLARTASKRIRCSEPSKEIGRVLGLVQDNPWNDEHWERAGWLYLALHNGGAARTCAEKALHIRPFHSRHLLLAVYARLALGIPEDAGILLARAKMANMVPLNHLRRGDIPRLLKSITDTTVHRRVSQEFKKSLEGNPFVSGPTRMEILARAGKHGPVLVTAAEPDNKPRLWIGVKDHFLRVFDGEKGLWENHEEKAASLGVGGISVSSIAFTQTHGLAQAEKRIYSFDRKSGVWQSVVVPKSGEKAFPSAVQGIDHRSVQVRFDTPDSTGPGVFHIYIPSEERWIEQSKRPEYRKKLAADIGAGEFARRRYGRIEDISDIQAAAAVSQWSDLRKYIKKTGETAEPGSLLTSEGRLMFSPLRRIAAAHGASSGTSGEYIQGMTLPGWSREGLSGRISQDALTGISRIGSEWVAIISTGYQNDPLSTVIYPDPEWTVSPASLKHAVRTAHSVGLKVLLKPHLNLAVEQKDNHMWRGMVKPRTSKETEAWFESYRKFLMPYIDLAIQEKIEMVSLGVELKGMSGCTEQWRALAAAVRKEGYTGKLTYSGHHETFTKVKFWDCLDYIGLDFYLGATHTHRPSLKNIIDGYRKHASRLKRISEKSGRPILFTEVGFNNLDGCNKWPWHWSSNAASLDNCEQAACYHAVLEVFPREEWFAGMFWWCWETGGPPLPSQPSYSPQSKLAELILEAYYKGEK